MRSSLALGLLVAGLAVGCGSDSPSAESVVRAWSQALNSGDNETAAKLFAPNARIVQGGRSYSLPTYQSAVDWNAGLPCTGTIVSITTHGNTSTATFRLGERSSSRCDGPGQKATAVFRVRDGKIVLWHQLEASGPVPGSAV